MLFVSLLGSKRMCGSSRRASAVTAALEAERRDHERVHQAGERRALLCAGPDVAGGAVVEQATWVSPHVWPIMVFTFGSSLMMPNTPLPLLYLHPRSRVIAAGLRAVRAPASSPSPRCCSPRPPGGSCIGAWPRSAPQASAPCWYRRRPSRRPHRDRRSGDTMIRLACLLLLAAIFVAPFATAAELPTRSLAARRS